MVPDLQGGFHGPGGDLKSLDDKGADQQGQSQGDDDRFRIFAKCGFFLDFWIFQFPSPFGLFKTNIHRRERRARGEKFNIEKAKIHNAREKERFLFF